MTNERIEAIRKIYKSAEWLEDDYGQTLIDVEKLGEVLKHAEALAAQVERWKRMAMAHDAYEDALLFAVGADEQEAARAELRAAHADLKAHGDLPNDGSN